MLSSRDNYGDGKDMFCRENHRQSPERHFNMEKNKREQNGSHAALLGLYEDWQEWRDFVAALDTTGCNGS